MTLKFVFYVEDPDTKEIVCEKSQMYLSDLSTDHLARVSPALATMKMLEDVSSRELTEKDWKQLREIDADEEKIRQILAAAGVIVEKYLRLKLREWAQKKMSEAHGEGG